MPFKHKLKEEIKAIAIAALYFGCWLAALLLVKSRQKNISKNEDKINFNIGKVEGEGYVLQIFKDENAHEAVPVACGGGFCRLQHLGH